MFLLSILGLVLASLAFLVVLRSWRRQRERDTWMALALKFPASDEAFVGARFPYANSGGEAIIGEEGFRAQPTDQLLPIDVPWSDVRAVRPGVGGGLRVRLPGGVVVLPGAASAEVADVIARRARRRKAAQKPISTGAPDSEG